MDTTLPTENLRDALLAHSPAPKSTTLTPETTLLSRPETAAMIGVKPNTLAVWESNKRYNLPVTKVGRLAKYRLSDIQAFLENNGEGA